MQTTKFLSVTGLVAALGAATLICSARDTEEQIQAREALRQKMKELNSPSATTTTPAAPAQPAKPATPAPAVAPVAAPQKAPVAVTPAPAPAPTPVPTPAPVAYSGSSKFAPVPEPVQNANAAQLQAALQQELALLHGATYAPVPEPVVDVNAAQTRAALRQEIAVLERSSATATKPTRSAYNAPSVAPLVMEVPPSLLSGPKAARLAELLIRYDANQITPQQYHVQRAAIIAEP